MQRATLSQPFVPGPPPPSTAESRANLRWLLTLQAASRRGLSDREAIEEANRTVPEALDPSRLPPEKRSARPSPFLVTSIRAASRSMSFLGLRRAHAVRDPAVHDLIVPIGADEIASWPQLEGLLDGVRDDFRDEAVVAPQTCRSLRQSVLDA